MVSSFMGKRMDVVRRASVRGIAKCLVSLVS